LKKLGKDTDKHKKMETEKLNTSYQNLLRFKKKDGGFGTFFDTNVCIF
jgi:hypothetical protein